MTRPLVALACASEDIDGVPYAAAREVYVRALEHVAGCAVVLAPGPGFLLAELLSRFDGLVLGGHQSDIDPDRYRGRPSAGPLDPDRDELALRLIPAAMRAGLPLLGLCRGLQELNVALGGTLRDLGSSHREDKSLPRDKQYLPCHDVRLTRGGLLARLTGRGAIRTNSLHGQVIDHLAPGLMEEGRTDDGVIEAVAAPHGFCLGVQWHPEWYATTDPVSGALFGAFGAAAARNAAAGRSRIQPRPLKAVP
jgi:putative glutamine amidotransferase